MNIKKNILKHGISGRILILSGLFLLFVSCGGTVKNTEFDFAENGIGLCKNILLSISDMKQIQDRKAYNEEFIKILNSSSPEFYSMESDDSLKSIKISYLNIENGFKCLEKVYSAYQLQLDSKITAGGANLSEKLYVACTALDSAALNEPTRSRFEKIKKNIGSGKYRVEPSIFQVTDIYAEVWNALTLDFQKKLINYQQEFEKGIRTIPVEAFNAEKIKTMIDEPYSNNGALVNLYKLKMIKDNQQEMIKIESKIKNLSDAFSLLIRIQGELMKRKQNKQKIQEMNTSIEVLLSNTNKSGI